MTSKRRYGAKQTPFVVLAMSTALVITIAWPLGAGAQAGKASKTYNGSSQRYEINQTFDGGVFYKDNNVWVYTKEFADLFGMPSQYIDDVTGVVAAAFRIEDASYQDCGYGGRADACRKVEQCLIDLYFDESKTPLPWATEVKSQWLPWYSSMRWLRPLERKEKPYGMFVPETPPGVIRNGLLSGPIVAFADPVSKREAIFTTNAGSDRSGDEGVSGSLGLIGYSRDFYRNLSIVNLRFGCNGASRKSVNIRLDVNEDTVFGPQLVRSNRVHLPAAFVQRIEQSLKDQGDRNTTFYRSLFPPPLGTKGTQAN